MATAGKSFAESGAWADAVDWGSAGRSNWAALIQMRVGIQRASAVGLWLPVVAVASSIVNITRTVNQYQSNKELYVCAHTMGC